MTAALKARFRAVARALSIPVAHLREVVAANVRLDLPAAEQDRLRTLILDKVASGEWLIRGTAGAPHKE